MKAGDTFFANVQGAHLTIVVAGPCPHGKVLYVKVTSDLRGIDHTCPIDPGDHPDIQHESFIHYGEADIGDATALDSAVTRRQVQMKEPVSREVLQRVAEGFSASEHARPRYEDFVQGRCSCDKRR